MFRALLVVLCALAAPLSASVLQRPEIDFKVFQFPANAIPRIDGDTTDWSLVPASYVYTHEHLLDNSGRGRTVDPASLQVSVKVGWVKGMNRLYFLYEAFDNYWDFSRSGLQNDTFEIVVDANLSGGPLIDRFHPVKDLGAREKYFDFHGVHAQNYHIFTPAEGKDWAMLWGPQLWLKELPYANAATVHNVRPGEAGKLVLEFWITPFDHALADGPSKSVESVLREEARIGLAWAIIDYDDANNRRSSFWNLSDKHTMYGQASELVAFRLMPLEPSLRKPLEAQWSFMVLDHDQRTVAFRDRSVGEVTQRTWDFGDGTTSNEQHPVHTYAEPGTYVVVLDVEGPAGKSRRSKVWDVTLK